MNSQIPATAGYIFNAPPHGAFSPDGRIPDAPSKWAVDTHNAEVSRQTIRAMVSTGRALLYLSNNTVSTWDGSSRWLVDNSRKSWHNMAGKDGRTDVWFVAFGAHWHGVNIGDNQIVRCRRVKS